VKGIQKRGQPLVEPTQAMLAEPAYR